MDFREAVRVIWPGEVSGVVARAVNLSPAGILVDAPTPTPCAVGSDVLCDVALPRGSRLLRGRVAHRRLLSSAKVGMGIEFVDLSPREAAELRDVVDESEEKPQRVKVRFEGTSQIVRARAFANETGFQLVTSLPFLKADTAVDLTTSDAGASAKGRVASVALEHGRDGVPRLLIDVRVDEVDPWRDSSSALTPVVETLIPPALDAVPEPVWEPEDLGATMDLASDLAPGPALPTIVEDLGAVPMVQDADLTEIVSLERPRGRWRALGGGMAAGALGLAVFVAAVVLMRSAPPPVAVPSIAPPVIGPERSPSAPPQVVTAPSIAPPAAVASVVTPAAFSLGLTGSLAGARRYPLSKPDGVAFNLPHARATLPIGTYQPDVPGLRSVWVRALPGGGTHLRFHFTAARPAPRLELARDGVHVTAP